MNDKIKDIIVRALKTFAQALGGVVIPEVCVLLNGGFPEDIHAAWLAMAPILAAGLAAGISAAWNLIAYYLTDAGKAGDDHE